MVAALPNRRRRQVVTFDCDWKTMPMCRRCCRSVHVWLSHRDSETEFKLRLVWTQALVQTDHTQSRIRPLRVLVPRHRVGEAAVTTLMKVQERHSAQIVRYVATVYFRIASRLYVASCNAE